jgi:hypothetical protein
MEKYEELMTGWLPICPWYKMAKALRNVLSMEFGGNRFRLRGK